MQILMRFEQDDDGEDSDGGTKSKKKKKAKSNSSGTGSSDAALISLRSQLRGLLNQVRVLVFHALCFVSATFVPACHCVSVSQWCRPAHP